MNRDNIGFRIAIFLNSVHTGFYSSLYEKQLCLLQTPDNYNVDLGGFYMNITIVISILVIAILLLTLTIIKTLIPVSKKKDVTFSLALGSFQIRVNM